jgi:hypothetical protein
MSLTKLSLAGNNLIIPGLFPAGDGKSLTFFDSMVAPREKKIGTVRDSQMEKRQL